MSNKMDRTKQHIIATFFEMMSKVGLEQISVADLARKAKINRGTFYYHFQDKEAVLEEIENEIYTNFKHLMQEKICLYHQKVKVKLVNIDKKHLFQESFLQLMLFLYERKDVVQVLVGKNGRPQFIEKIESLYCDTVRSQIDAKKNEDQRIHYLQEFVFSGVISVIKCWMRNGAKETPEEIANLLALNLTTIPIKIFDNDFSV